MPYPPEGFFEVARELNVGNVPTGEGRDRTVASRAYYGAYWATCVAICRTHKISPPCYFHHETLSLLLAGYKSDDDVREFGTWLNTLRQRRVHADYRLRLELTDDTANDSVVDAKKLLDKLPSIEPRLPWIEPTRDPGA